MRIHWYLTLAVKLAIVTAVLVGITPPVAAQSIALDILSHPDNVRAVQAELPSLRSEASPASPATRQSNCATPEQLKTSLRPLREIHLDLRAPDPVLPADCYVQHQRTSSGTESSPERSPLHMQWAASGLVHYPLYFEDVSLERYGVGPSPLAVPAISTGRFCKDIFLLPYQMGLEHPYCKLYALGLKRPGNPAPSVTEHLPWSERAAVYQAGAIATGALLLP